MLKEVDWILPTELDTNKNANDHTKKLWEKHQKNEYTRVNELTFVYALVVIDVLQMLPKSIIKKVVFLELILFGSHLKRNMEKIGKKS